MSLILNLPEAILLHIKAFLSIRPLLVDDPDVFEFHLEEEFEFEKIVKENNQWLRFLNTTSQLAELKRKSRYLFFNRETTIRFLTDSAFRALIHYGIIQNPERQLGFIINQFLRSTLILDSLHFLTIQNVPLLKLVANLSIQRITYLSFINCHFSPSDFLAFSPLQNLKYLEFTRAHSVERFPFNGCSIPNLVAIYFCYCKNLTSISGLGEACPLLHTIELAECDSLVEGYEILAKVDRIILLSQVIPDLNLLSQAKSLKLGWLTRIQFNALLKLRFTRLETLIIAWIQSIDELFIGNDNFPSLKSFFLLGPERNEEIKRITIQASKIRELCIKNYAGRIKTISIETNLNSLKIVREKNEKKILRFFRS